MAQRRIFKEGEEVLRKKCRPVDIIDERIHTLLDDMKDTLYEAEGVGLAAPQVGILRRIVVIDVGDGLYEFINPEIIHSEGEAGEIEGCLSIPDFSGYVIRPQNLVVRALDRNGELKEYNASGYFARAVCHELDHLDGILFRDIVIETPPEYKARQKEPKENE